MARTIDTGDYVAKRGQLTRVDCRGIVYDPGLNKGRPLDLQAREAGWEEEYYGDLLEAIRRDPEGWQNGCPGACERMPDGRVRLRMGFRRYEALVYENGLREARGERPVPYVFVFVDGDERELLAANIRENVARRNLGLVGEARLLKELKDTHGLTEAEAAAHFSDEQGKPRGQSWANDRLRLLKLPKSLLARVHSGEIGLRAALMLLNLDAETRARLVAKGDLSLSRIREATEGVKPRARTASEIRRELHEQSETSPNPRMRALAAALQPVLDGASLDDVYQALRAVFEGGDFAPNQVQEAH